ncbi:MAG: glycine zipper family protein [Nitrosomonas sp.]|nr:glycine zipper family protein [Nitrosomonas sp.]MDP1951847.1 glycine zipper family protein [Nitrosomonas sp.]
MLIIPGLSVLLMMLLLTACVSIPTGPSVMTLPGSGKSFDQFRSDDYQCRQYAHEQVGGMTPNQSSRSSGIESAAIGAGIGAIAGVALGGGQGAAIGAGTGLLAGSLIGTGTASASGYEGQQRYDISYIQCMYANGHRVPVSGNITGSSNSNNSNRNISNPPSESIPPPPPPGNPPPPPR